MRVADRIYSDQPINASGTRPPTSGCSESVQQAHVVRAWDSGNCRYAMEGNSRWGFAIDYADGIASGRKFLQIARGGPAGGLRG